MQEKENVDWSGTTTWHAMMSKTARRNSSRELCGHVVGSPAMASLTMGLARLFGSFVIPEMALPLEEQRLSFP